jgi:hypothetical protein
MKRELTEAQLKKCLKDAFKAGREFQKHMSGAARDEKFLNGPSEFEPWYRKYLNLPQ